MKPNDDARFSTICIHAGQEPDPSTGAIITPIYQTSTYVQEGLGQHKGYEYGRTQNPTRMALERNVAAIEGGLAGFAFASGMAAIDAILTRLESGDHVLVSDNTYGGTFRLFERVRRKFGLCFSYVDSSNLDLIAPAITPRTRYLFLESPTNPLLRITGTAPGSWWTTPSPAPTSSSRWRSEPTSSCTAPRSSSTDTATASAASSC
jgi:cystathionine beta-lyase/cystathionine gamma-synthase